MRSNLFNKMNFLIQNSSGFLFLFLAYVGQFETLNYLIAERENAWKKTQNRVYQNCVNPIV